MARNILTHGHGLKFKQSYSKSICVTMSFIIRDIRTSEGKKLEGSSEQTPSFYHLQLPEVGDN